MALPFIGRKTQILIGRETTFGTKATTFFPVLARTFNENPKQNKAEHGGTFGRIEDNHRSDVIHEWSEPEFQSVLTDDLAGVLMYAALGDLTTIPVTTTYIHDFTVLNTNAHPSFTIIFKDDVETKMITGCRLKTLTIESEGEYATYTASWMGLKATTTTETYTAVEENIFLPKHREIKFATTPAGLATAPVVDVKSFSVTIEKNVENYFGGSDQPQHIVNKQLVVTGNVSALYENDTYYDYFQDGERLAMAINLVNTDVAFAVGNPTVGIQLDSMDIREWSKDTGLDDIVMQGYEFKGEYKLSTAQMIKSVIQNETATY